MRGEVTFNFFFFFGQENKNTGVPWIEPKSLKRVTDTRGPGGEPGPWAETACAESRSRRAPGLMESWTSHNSRL